MNDVDEVQVLDLADDAIEIKTEVVHPISSSQNDIPLYKTERGYNINVNLLARDARENIDKVRVIDIPSPVKVHKVGRSEYEAPTLSEVGGGNKNTFCQVVAGKDGRPVSVDDVHYINTDPARSNINHGTAAVAIGNYFSCGWSMKADVVILVYEIIKISEYTQPGVQNKDDKPQMIAKLTCQLVGFEISNWRSQDIDFPPHLFGLVEATRDRMRNDTDIPFYMDIFRVVRPIEELNKIAIEATECDFLEHNESDHQFMLNVMREIQDIRTAQYEALPPNTIKRKVEPLRVVETLILDPNSRFIDITLTPVRTDIENTTFRLRLTPNNFADESSNRMLLERGLTLNQTSFDRLKIKLENSPEKIVIVHLTSLR